MTASRRLGTCVAASAVLHGGVIAVAVLVTARSVPPLTVIPVALIGSPGGGGGGGGPPAAVAPAEHAPARPPPAEAHRPPRHRPRPAPAAVAAHRAEPEPAPPAARPAPSVGGVGDGVGGGSGGSGGGSGGGNGTGLGGGSGSGAARVAYGENPPPPYPLIARRLGMEGLVLLEVVVAPDGHAEDVRVVHSSGHQSLDESAADTVRSRWRFIPASRDGTPIESRVTVPIRFRLNGAAAG